MATLAIGDDHSGSAGSGSTGDHLHLISRSVPACGSVARLRDPGVWLRRVRRGRGVRSSRAGGEYGGAHRRAAVRTDHRPAPRCSRVLLGGRRLEQARNEEAVGGGCEPIARPASPTAGRWQLAAATACASPVAVSLWPPAIAARPVAEDEQRCCRVRGPVVAEPVGILIRLRPAMSTTFPGPALPRDQHVVPVEGR
ncbi:hypothetical protein SAMN04490239_2801 [Rhodococcus koreensis]|uniref:Uncharacterized protein n=1 Tax=Rhodococcus koreensis TaxID=99653 RepID=A0A1H4PLC7_9NOCA|nr:hypothetical protein SAMN04490239_2801 [Rhodococcus koreensis]